MCVFFHSGSGSHSRTFALFLPQVSHTEPEEIAFKIHQKMAVGVLQPAAVSVYEYYDHQHNNRECQGHQDTWPVSLIDDFTAD